MNNGLKNFADQQIARLADAEAHRIEEWLKGETDPGKRIPIISLLVMDSIYSAHSGMVHMTNRACKLAEDALAMSPNPGTILLKPREIR